MTLATYTSSSHPAIRASTPLERCVAQAIKKQAASFAQTSRQQGYGHCHYRVQDLRCRGFKLAGIAVDGDSFLEVRIDYLTQLVCLWLREDGFTVNFRKIDITIESGYRYNFWIRW